MEEQQQRRVSDTRVPQNRTVRDNLIRGLNSDLAREYKTVIQYVVFSQTLKGAEYGKIADELEAHASQELSHAMKIARQIDYLGGNPTTIPEEAQFSEDARDMLQIDLRAEEDTIRNYTERVKLAEQAGEFALAQVIREIIVNEQDHAIDLKDALGME